MGVSETATAANVSNDDIVHWSETAAIPRIPAADLDVFAQMKRHPALREGLVGWRFRPLAELHTTKEKRLYDFNLDQPSIGHTLEVWTGGTFTIWNPDHGRPYAYADPKAVERLLLDKRSNQINMKSSAFYGRSLDWASDRASLPMRFARIAFRDVTKNDNSRTMVCALVPPDVVLVHKSPYLFRQAGDERDESFILGVLSSIPFDWFARRFVELAMSFELLGTFPVPQVDPSNGHRLRADGGVLSTIDVRPLVNRIIDISGRLAAVDDRYTEWAERVGVEVGTVRSPTEKEVLVAELDALVSLLYGLTRDQVEQLFASFHRGWDYRPRLSRVLEFFDEWSGKVPK